MALEGVTIGGGTAAPAAGGSPATPVSGALKGVMIGGGASGPAPVKAPAPVAASAPLATPSIAPAKPADTSNIFSKFTGFVSGAVSKGLDALGKAIEPPDQSTLGTDVNKNTLAYLPSELARQIPGVADIQDDPSIAANLTGKDVVDAVPGALADTAKGFIKAPITAVADLYDAARVFAGKNPNASFDIPGLGKVTSDVFNVTQAIQNGEDPVVAALNSGSSSIFNALFFADVVNRGIAPRSVKVAETTGNLNDIQKPTGTGPRPVIDTGPKSGRLYEKPTAYNKGGAQVMPPDMLAKMKSQGVSLGSRFDPKQPVYFKVTVGKGGAYTGEIMQLKPSYLKTAYDKIFGKSAGETTVPALLGEQAPINTKVLNPSDLAPAATAATPADVTVLHSQTVNESDIKDSLNHTLMGKDQAVQPTEAPKPQVIPSQAETVVHNILRLGEGDTAKAKEGAVLLQKDIVDAVTKHGGDVVAQALQEKIGVDAPTAATLIKEAQAPATPGEFKKISDTLLGKASPEVAAKQTATELAKEGGLHEDITRVVSETHGIEKAKASDIAATALEKETGVPASNKADHVNIPPSLSTLHDEARKYGTFAEFEKAMKGHAAVKQYASETLKENKLPSLKKIYTDAHKAMEKKYKTIHQGGVIKMVDGEPVKIVDGIETFAHKGDGGWIVSEASTGRFLADSQTKEGAIAKAKSNIDKVGEDKFRDMLKKNQLPKTQKEKVKDLVAEQPLHIKDVAKLTNILEPNVRRILGEGAKDGTFERVKEGVYVLKTKAGTYAYVEMGDAVDSLADMVKEGMKFDSVILDPAYYSRALIGGNRGIKKWNFIMPDQFGKVMDSVSKLMKHSDSHVYLMLSGARTAQKDMNRYVDAAVAAGFKAVGEGEYHKLFKDGSPVTNVRGEIAAPERMILLTQSGSARAGEIASTLNFQYIRPPVASSYQTEKPAALMKALIQQSTIEGETVLDPFGGSGVTGAEALRTGRNAVLVEREENAVENVIKPRIEEAASEINDFVEKNYKESPIAGVGEDTRTRNMTTKEAITQEAIAETNKKKPGGERGFVNPGAVSEDVARAVKNLHDTIEHSVEVGEVVGEISNSIYKNEGARKAMKVRLTNLVNDVRKTSTPAERENVYHYMEDSSVELTEHESQELLPIVDEMDRVLTQLRAEARTAGIHITGDILDEMTPRNAMEKGGVIDKALDAYREGKKRIINGGNLSKSVGSGAKHRVFHTITDESGKRTVVSIKDGKVTAFNKGVLTDMGSSDKIVSPKVKEYFDESVKTKLEQLAKDLGVTHERHATGRTEGLGNGRAGVSFGGADLIKTRLGPTSVLAHELGHQIDHKYGMQEAMKEETYDAQHKREIKDEMRALADKRFEGRDVTKHFKQYVRKGSEKMAVQFEAYIANRQMFKDVAPHLYDDFRQFLSDHVELRPFLNIQPSISLGGETHGGELKQGIAGKEFVDKNGNSHIVGQATTKEIEANTSTKYYKDPLANYALAIERTANAVRAARLLEKIKTSPDYKDMLIKEGEGTIPANFKTTTMPQFRGYYMEPHLAEAFNDLQKRQEGGLYIPVYDEVNNLLISALVINPVMHFPNVAMGWGSAMAADGVPFKLNFTETFKQVVNKDPEYLKWIEKGAPFQYLRQTNGEFADAMLKDFTDAIVSEPTHYEALAKQLGYANPVEWVKGLEKISSDATWVGNDVMLFHALKEYQRVYGVSEEKAIAEVSKRMADYRIPPRVLGVRALSVAMQNNALLMFMRYHYSGVLKPWFENIYDSARPGATKAQRFSGLRTLAYFAAMYFIWQYGLNKALQKGTGDPNAYMSMPGAMKVPQNIVKSIQSGSPIPIISGTFSLTPSAKIAGSILDGGYDISNFMKPIFGPGGEGLQTFAQNAASPYNAVSGAFNGTGSWTDYALSLGGVYLPKTTVPTQVFNSMINLEKPQVEAQMKALIANGDTAGAVKIAHDFNTRLQTAIKNADVSNGNSGDTARVDYFFQQYPNGLGQKGYAIRMPSAQSMTNYEAKQGLTVGQKQLPGPGNQNSKKGAPSDITNHTNPGTVKGVTSNGVTLYNRMSNESAVKAEMMGGKITPGFQLDHIVPLEGGGTNIIDNLSVITVAEDNINQPVEDFVGQQVRNGAMTLAQSTEINIRFKAGLGQKLTPPLMALYNGKYGGKPLTLAQVYDYAHTVGQ